MIEKLDSSLEPFSRPKLFASIYDACKHLPQPAQMADDLTTTVVKHILTSKSAVLSQKDLKALISTTLSRFDAAAGVQYDAYHR